MSDGVLMVVNYFPLVYVGVQIMNIAGNHRGGLSVGKAIASGCKAAELVIAYLESPPDEKPRRE